MTKAFSELSPSNKALYLLLEDKYPEAKNVRFGETQHLLYRLPLDLLISMKSDMLHRQLSSGQKKVKTLVDMMHSSFQRLEQLERFKNIPPNSEEYPLYQHVVQEVELGLVKTNTIILELEGEERDIQEILSTRTTSNEM